jgi:mono/diheme cytochrome c family protein
VALALALAGVAAPMPLRAQMPDEARGSLIYSSGRGADGRALQFRLLTAGARPLPANGFACVNCHGADGKGGREGSIVMADIRYATLTRPLAAAPPWNRARAPYTDATLARAITEGIDSSGQQLDASMPRWRLSEAELADLIGYLKRLGSPR